MAFPSTSELEPVFTVEYRAFGEGGTEARVGGFWTNLRYLEGWQQPERGSALVNDKLGAALTIRLKNALAAAGSRTGGTGFELHVMRVREGSLTALFGVDDFAALAAAVAGIGPEIVLTLIDSCAAQALQDITGASGFESRVMPKAILTAALARKEQITTEAPKPTWSNVLIAAQRSFWLVPLLLALAVLWIAFSGLMAQLARLHEQEERFARSQAATVEAGVARVKQSETLILELIAQLRKEREAPPASQCPCEACCSAIRCPTAPQKPVALKTPPSCKR